MNDTTTQLASPGTRHENETVPCFDCGYAVRLADGAWTDTDGGTECRGFGSPHYATQR